MSEIEISPAESAEYDQAWAASVGMLACLIQSYVLRRREDEAAGAPQAVTIVAMAESLAENWDTDQLVSALCAATVALSETGPSHLRAPRG